jgi:protein phosphatase slingshot
MTKLNEKYFVVKDAAIILPRVNTNSSSVRSANNGSASLTSFPAMTMQHDEIVNNSAASAAAVNLLNYNSLNSSSVVSNASTTNTGDILVHLQAMIAILRPADTLILAVRLFSYVPDRLRYLVIVETRPIVVSSSLNQQTTRDSCGDDESGGGCSGRVYEESAILGLDLERVSAKQKQFNNNENEEVRFYTDEDSNDATMSSDSTHDLDGDDSVEFECKVGLVLPIYANSEITLDGDGGFKFVSHQTTHIFKPVSIQAMWSAYQYLHKAFENARKFNFYSQVSLDNLLALYSGGNSSSMNLSEPDVVTGNRRVSSPQTTSGELAGQQQNSQLVLNGGSSRQQHHEWVKHYSSLIAKFRSEQHINEWYQKEERSVQREDFTTPYFDCLKLCKEQEVKELFLNKWGPKQKYFWKFMNP